MTRPRVIVITALSLLACIGCAPTNGVKTGAARTESRKDSHECERYARQGSHFGSPVQAYLKCTMGEVP